VAEAGVVEVPTSWAGLDSWEDPGDECRALEGSGDVLVAEL